MLPCAFTYMIKFNPLNYIRLVVSKPFLHEEKKRDLQLFYSFPKMKYMGSDTAWISLGVLRLLWQCPSHQHNSLQPSLT